MVLRNGRPNDILSVSRDARANSTSQSTALFPTVILAGRATLAICIGKPFWRDAACIVPRRMQPMNACMHACSHAFPACAYDFRPLRFPRKKDPWEATRDDAKSILGRRAAASGLRDLRDARWRDSFFFFLLPRQIVLLAVDSVSSTSSIFSRPN